jgi:molecular chaperone GrpE
MVFVANIFYAIITMIYECQVMSDTPLEMILMNDQQKDVVTEQEPIIVEPTAETEEVEEVVSGPLVAAQEELAEMKDQLLRSKAEMENIRRRTIKEVADARKFAVERFATDLLDVVDNLERALAVEEGNEQGMRDGVQLTLDAWHAVMGKFKMERVDAMGEQFDPHKHEALSKMPAEEAEGTVIAQHCAGYTLHGRLIRPAKVLVSSGPAA